MLMIIRSCLKNADREGEYKMTKIELLDKIKRLEMINKKLNEVMEGVGLGSIPDYQISFRHKNRGGEPFKSDPIPFGTPNAVHKFIGDEIEENERNIAIYLERLNKSYKGEM